MDRNGLRPSAGLARTVALRKESVDRNRIVAGTSNCRIQSLSARRAWIEIVKVVIKQGKQCVALRKESVDRNCSLACRRLDSVRVALRKESVDRNVYGALAITNLKKSLSARRAWNVSLSDCSGWFCSCGYPL